MLSKVWKLSGAFAWCEQNGICHYGCYHSEVISGRLSMLSCLGFKLLIKQLDDLVLQYFKILTSMYFVLLSAALLDH